MAKLAAMETRNSNDMLQLFEKWQSSNQSMAKFAQSQGISRTTLYYWFAKFNKQTKKSTGTGKKSFSQIEVASPQPINKPGIIITFPSGISVEFTDLVDPGFIKQLIS